MPLRDGWCLDVVFSTTETRFTILSILIFDSFKAQSSRNSWALCVIVATKWITAHTLFLVNMYLPKITSFLCISSLTLILVMIRRLLMTLIYTVCHHQIKTNLAIKDLPPFFYISNFRDRHSMQFVVYCSYLYYVYNLNNMTVKNKSFFKIVAVFKRVEWKVFLFFHKQRNLLHIKMKTVWSIWLPETAFP